MTQDALVKILNDRGEHIGSKPRSEIDKVHDIVHCADVLLGQNGEWVLSRVPEGAGLYVGLLAASSATMVREGETAEAAAHRSLEKELGIDTTLTLVGEHFFTYPDGVKRLKTTFTADFEGALTPNPKDVAELVYMTRDEITTAIEKTPALFAPTFLELWKMYENQI